MKRLFLLPFFLGVPMLGAPLPGSADMTLTGSFANPAPRQALHGTELVQGSVYGEWPNRAANGRAATGIFVAPDNLEFEVVGYPKLPGLRMFLEDAANPERQLTLTVARDTGPIWITRRWRIPRQWRQRRVRLIVEDAVVGGSTPSAERWIGFTLPREYKIWNISSFAYAQQAMRRLALQWILLVMPGFAFALWFSRHRIHPPELTVTAMLAVCGVTAFLAFFVFIFSAPAGKIYSIAVPLISAGVAVLLRRRIQPVLRKPVGGILALWLFASAFYLSAGLLYRNQDQMGEYIQDRFFSHQLPPDNVLPLMLSGDIYNRGHFRPAFFLDIQSSDRPPLQSGFTLLQLIFWRKPEDQYLFLAVLLQTSWIPALWVLLRSMKVNGPPTLAAIAMTALSQFAFVHELFVWPKLLSASFGLLALSRFGWVTKQEASRTDAILAGVLAALAMLSHGGVLMTVIGFALLVLLWRRPAWGWLGQAALAGFFLYLPWVLYQKLYDPPGDALLKLHLAGTIDREHSLGWLIWNSYAKLGFSGWLATKWANIKFLFWSGAQHKEAGYLARRTMEFCELNFYSLFPALGLANAGFLLRFGCGREQRAVPNRLLLIATVSLAVWMLVMFAPESTTIHQSSFVMMILFFAALSLSIAECSWRLAVLAIALQWIEFVTIAVFGEIWTRNEVAHISDLAPDVGMFTVFFFLLASLTGWFVKECRSSFLI